MGGFITKDCPLPIYFQFRFCKSCTRHVFYVWKTMTWIDKWPYFSISFAREPQFLKEKWSPPSSHPGDRKKLFLSLSFYFLFQKGRAIIQRGDGAPAPLCLGGGPTPLASPSTKGRDLFLCSGSVQLLCTALLQLSQSWKLEFPPF